MIPVPNELVALLVGVPIIGGLEQAFPFLTVDVVGLPHSAFLSRAEMDVDDTRRHIIVAVASPTTAANLRRDGRAGLLAIGGESAHHVKLHVVRTVEIDGVLGCVLEVVEHKADSVGVALAPISYRATTDLARIEAWGRSARVLDALR